MSTALGHRSRRATGDRHGLPVGDVGRQTRRGRLPPASTASRYSRTISSRRRRHRRKCRSGVPTSGSQSICTNRSAISTQLDRPAQRQLAPGRPQILGDGRARHRHHAGLLFGSRRRRRRSGATCGSTSHTRRAGEPARDQNRLRGTRVGTSHQHMGSVLGCRAPRRSFVTGDLPRQLPRAVAHTRARCDLWHRGRSRREDLLPAVGRCAADEHGRAAVEPSPSALPRPGGVRPDSLRRPHSDGRLRRPPVTGSLQ